MDGGDSGYDKKKRTIICQALRLWVIFASSAISHKNEASSTPFSLAILFIISRIEMNKNNLFFF
jgi:hypothetical protein